MNREIERHPASFRDPAGFVFVDEGRVRRAVTEFGLGPARAVRSTGLIDRLVAAGRLLPETTVATALEGHPDVRMVLEHPPLPFVSYPYEWPFLALQHAALLQLDIQLEALQAGVMLTDATAYNVQFIGAKPVFIDHLAFRPYREGELWAGHRQFCEQFLNPLLLEHLFGVGFQAWYRGRLEGIPGDELARMLTWRHKLNWLVLSNVVLPARLQRLAGDRRVTKRVEQASMRKPVLEQMLTSLRRSIARMATPGASGTTWAGYDSSIPADEQQTIATFVADCVSHVKPSLAWDLGCNTGRYSEVALRAGADYVVGLDADRGALDQACRRAEDQNLRLLPLLIDLANPSPAQGWRGAERDDLISRGRPGVVIALAVAHHIVIGRNIPLAQVVDELTSLAPEGVVGFVPPGDERAQALFRGREEIFRDYTLDNFLTLLQRRARIVRRQAIPNSARTLVWYSTGTA
jgi:ribosomal protein L11 methylase PrmA